MKGWWVSFVYHILIPQSILMCRCTYSITSQDVSNCFNKLLATLQKPFSWFLWFNIQLASKLLFRNVQKNCCYIMICTWTHLTLSGTPGHKYFLYWIIAIILACIYKCASAVHILCYLWYIAIG